MRSESLRQGSPRKPDPLFSPYSEVRPDEMATAYPKRALRPSLAPRLYNHTSSHSPDEKKMQILQKRALDIERMFVYNIAESECMVCGIPKIVTKEADGGYGKAFIEEAAENPQVPQ
jgi:hypothetical protein